MLRARVACALGGDTPPLATTGCARGALHIDFIIMKRNLKKNTLNRKERVFT
jgi:hypothetical protein